MFPCRRLFSISFPLMLLFLFGGCAPKQTVQPQLRQPAKVAVVLGAGASRGFAHIGVLKILELNKVPVHMVVGTSAGSFVGSLYAYGLNAFQLQKIALAISKNDVVDLAIPDNGFVKGEKLEEYLNAALRNTPIEKFRIPFYAVSTSIPQGQEVVFGKGNAGIAVRASCAIPGVFRPVRIAEQMYVDGGVVSPIAVEAAKRQGADIVIAVDISSDPDRTQPDGTIATWLQTINIMYAKLSGFQISKADIVIRPKVGHIGSADFDRRHEAILEGERAALEMMPKIMSLIENLRSDGRL